MVKELKLKRLDVKEIGEKNLNSNSRSEVGEKEAFEDSFAPFDLITSVVAIYSS